MKEKLLCLCTCTAIEIMTAAGVTGYLLYLGEAFIAMISLLVFSKVIVFHFIADYFDKKQKKKQVKLINFERRF